MGSEQTTGEEWMWVTFVEGPDTPREHQHRVGESVRVGRVGDLFYAPGVEGMLQGVPGVLREGWRWEIKPVDMRSPREKKLDEIQDVLRGASRADSMSDLQFVALQAQLMILEVQLDDLRRNGG